VLTICWGLTRGKEEDQERLEFLRREMLKKAVLETFIRELREDRGIILEAGGGGKETALRNK